MFREGIPGNELMGQKTPKGPFVVGGVGDLERTANDVWLVSFEKNIWPFSAHQRFDSG